MSVCLQLHELYLNLNVIFHWIPKLHFNQINYPHCQHVRHSQ